MTVPTARRAIDLLLAESGSAKVVHVAFFGGEPLTNLELIREVVRYARGKESGAGKFVDFTLTTNGTLLSRSATDFLIDSGIGVTLSMDGPAEIHDRNRHTTGGRGSYAIVAEKARRLIERHPRPVGARVTLTRGTTEVARIFEHLTGVLGFAEVGFAPVTAADDAAFNLSDEELVAVFSGLKDLGQRYVEAAVTGRYIGLSNLHHLLRNLVRGSRSFVPCGAGIGLLGVDHDGALSLCHRFSGSRFEHFGSVFDGVDRDALAQFLAAAADRSGTGCATCRIRHLCAGGCYHESYVRYGQPTHPTYHHCNLMRTWIDFGIESMYRIHRGNPSFFDRHFRQHLA